jgi:1-deoxy-D-xylulose-5-phosphate reductoisomerase
LRIIVFWDSRNPVKDIRHIALLGATGSIGRSALEVIAAFPEKFRVSYLTAHRNIKLLQEQILQFHPRGVVVLEEANASRVRDAVGNSTDVLAGPGALQDIVKRDDVDLVVSALVGFAGLEPTLCALQAGKDVALANKETLVAGGDLVMRTAREHKARLLPVDSEHSAILQCLQGEDPATIDRLLLTASGGPFLAMSAAELEHVTVEQALNHPTWRMGSKITIDSATLMNKGLEVIEAFWLFGLPADRIEVVIHPQSIIHSMVEFVDGSVKAQLGIPDMKLPIQYALMYPERAPAMHRRVDFAELGRLTFFAPDTARFRCLALAYRALRAGGTAPVVLNAANEVAVGLFLDGRLPFSGIADIIEGALDAHAPCAATSLETIIHADRETRERIAQTPAFAR